jgi:HK97 family phage major capsid protein
LTVSKTKRYVTSAGSTFSFDAELAEVSDDTFTEAEVEIETHRGTGFIQASMEAWQDSPHFDSEVAKIIADGKQRVEANAWINGTGSDQPTGIEVALNGGASEVDAAGEALVADDVYGLLEALPPRFRENAKWQMELSTRNFIHRLFSPSGSEPALIEKSDMLGVPFSLNSSIDPYSDVDDTATATNRVLFVGDWTNYVILDRVGTSVYFLPPGVLSDTANNLPSGKVGWFAVWRTGAEPLTIAAFRMLDVATTA